MTTRRMSLLYLVLLLAGGCSSQPAETPAVTASAPTAATPTKSAAPNVPPEVVEPKVSTDQVKQVKPSPDAEPTKEPDALAALIPSVEMSELFAIPKAPLEPIEPEPAPVPVPVMPTTEKGLPPVRLIGFVDVDRKKVLLSIAGKVNLMEEGDVNTGIQIVRIDPPTITLKPAEEGDEFDINLYDQPWSRQPAPRRSSSGNGSQRRAGSSSDYRAPLPGLSPAPPSFPAFPPAPAAPPALPSLPSRGA